MKTYRTCLIAVLLVMLASFAFAQPPVPLDAAPAAGAQPPAVSPAPGTGVTNASQPPTVTPTVVPEKGRELTQTEAGLVAGGPQPVQQGTVSQAQYDEMVALANRLGCSLEEAVRRLNARDAKPVRLASALTPSTPEARIVRNVVNNYNTELPKSWLAGLRKQLGAIWVQIGSLWAGWKNHEDRIGKHDQDIKQLRTDVDALQGAAPVAPAPAIPGVPSPAPVAPGVQPAPEAPGVTPAPAVPAEPPVGTLANAVDPEARKAAADALEAAKAAQAAADKAATAASTAQTTADTANTTANGAKTAADTATTAATAAANAAAKAANATTQLAQTFETERSYTRNFLRCHGTWLWILGIMALLALCLGVAHVHLGYR